MWAIGSRPSNYDQPEDVPLRPGPVGHLVIARLVWPEGEEFVPAVANRWTRTHVMVIQYVRDADGRRREVGDVAEGGGRAPLAATAPA